MNAQRFHTTIGEDGVIRPPEGLVLLTGAVEVIVLQPECPSTDEDSERVKQPWPLLERLARAAQELGVEDMPADLAENHDHYAHGAPKGLDRL